MWASPTETHYNCFPQKRSDDLLERAGEVYDALNKTDQYIKTPNKFLLKDM